MPIMSPARSILLILLLWLSGLGAAMQFAKIAVPFDAFRALYPNAGGGIGWMLSIISVIGIFLGMTAGILARRFGYQRILIAGIVIGAVMSFWQATFPSLPTMLFSRLIEGISHLIIVVVAPTLIAQYASDRIRPIAMTLWSTFFGVAFAITAWIGLDVVSHSGLETLFYLHGIYMAAIAVLLFLAFRAFAPRLPRSDAPIDIASIIRWHLDAIRSPFVATPAVGWLFYTATFVALLAIIPDTLPADQSTSLMGILPIISIVTALAFMPFLLSHFSAISLVTFGFLLATLITLLSFSNIPTPYIWISLFAVLGIIQSASFAAVPQLNTSAQDQVLSNGIMAQAGNLGNTLGMPFLLLILNVTNSQGMMIAIAAIYAAGAAGHILMTKLRQRA
jgi:MFS family permease